jgi:hypothetical protein
VILKFLFFPQAFWENMYPARSLKYETYDLSDNVCGSAVSLKQIHVAVMTKNSSYLDTQGTGLESPVPPQNLLVRSQPSYRGTEGTQSTWCHRDTLSPSHRGKLLIHIKGQLRKLPRPEARCIHPFSFTSLHDKPTESGALLDIESRNLLNAASPALRQPAT